MGLLRVMKSRIVNGGGGLNEPLKITTDKIHPLPQGEDEGFLKELDSIEVRISNDCKSNVCKTKAYDKKTGKLVYETNCKNAKLHGRQYISLGNPDDYYSSEIELHYKDGKLHGKQRIKFPGSNTEFGVINGKLYGEYSNHKFQPIGNGTHDTFNMVDGVAIGDSQHTTSYGRVGDYFESSIQRQYDSSGNLDGTQMELYEGGRLGLESTHEIKIISCKKNKCKLYATYKREQSDEISEEINKVFEAFIARGFQNDLKVLLKIIGDEK